MIYENDGWTILDPPEKFRRYVFPGNIEAEFENVTKISIINGEHRLETAEGEKAIINNKWLYVIIEADEWTF